MIDPQNKKVWIRGQAAIEYLSTYGWAILTLTIVFGVLVASGILSQKAPSICIINNQFICSNANLKVGGTISMSITQITGVSIGITGMACASNLKSINMVVYSPQIKMDSNTNITESIQCYVNNTIFTGKVGSSYSGYIVINYTNLKSTLKHTVIGKVVQTAE